MTISKGKVKASQHLRFHVKVKGNLDAPIPDYLLSLDNVKEFYSKKDIEKEYDGELTLSCYVCDFCLDELFPDYEDIEVDEYYILNTSDDGTSVFEISTYCNPEVEISVRSGGYEENTYCEHEIIDTEDFCVKSEKDFEKEWKKELISEINCAFKLAGIKEEDIICTDITLTDFEEAEYDIGDANYYDDEYEEDDREYW